jgi:hypothetical protein
MEKNSKHSNNDNGDTHFEYLRKDNFLKQFLDPSFSTHLFLSSRFQQQQHFHRHHSHTYQQEVYSQWNNNNNSNSSSSSSSNDQTLELLENGISNIDQEIRELVSKHENELLSQTFSLHSNELENELKIIRDQVRELSSSVHLLQNRYMIGQQSYVATIHGKIIQLRNMYHAAEMLQFVDRALKNMIKIQKDISQMTNVLHSNSNGHSAVNSNRLDHEALIEGVKRIDVKSGADVPLSIAKIALYLSELEDLLQFNNQLQKYKKTGIDVIDQQLDSLEKIRKIVFEFSLQCLENGCAQLNQSQIASSCQVFFNLKQLRSVVLDYMVEKRLEQIKKNLPLYTQLFAIVRNPQNQPNSANYSKLILNNLRKVLFEDYRNAVRDIHTLEHILRKKRCSYTGTLFISVVNVAGDSSSFVNITDQFWHQLSNAITKEFVNNLSSLYQVRTVLQQEYRQLYVICNEFAQAISNYLTQNFDFNHWIRNIVGQYYNY